MGLKPIHLVMIFPAVLAVGMAAQEAPRLDGSNVNPPSGWAAARPDVKPSPLFPAGAADPLPGSTSIVPADTAPRAATIVFQNGLLTIHATNSSLSQILRDTSFQTGMAIEGTPEDQRVFGDFGPAPVDTVVAQLLDGGPSNYLLFGRTSNQAPRTLVVTPKASLAPGQVLAAAAAAQPANSDDDDDDDAPATPPVAPIRPMAPQAQSPNGAQPNIRTPQQILDDMQRRRREQPPQPPADQ